jgi:hypothetical protein
VLGLFTKQTSALDRIQRATSLERNPDDVLLLLLLLLLFKEEAP